MGNDDGSSSNKQLFEGLLNQSFCSDIEVSGGFVKNQDARVAEGLRAPLFTPNRRLRAISRPRSPSNFTAFRVAMDRAVHIRIDALARSSCRCSPLAFTVFRVVVGRGIRPRIGALA